MPSLVRWNVLDGSDEFSAFVVPRGDLLALEAETTWRRDVMSDAKMALACGDAQGAYEALTRHEREGYPWTPGAPSRSPSEAHEFLRVSS